MQIKSCPIFPGICTSKIPAEFSLSGDMCRGTWFVSVILSLWASLGNLTFLSNKEPEKGKRLQCHVRKGPSRKYEFPLVTVWLQWELFIQTCQKPLLLKLERMFVVMLAESPVSSPLGTGDKKLLLFSPLYWKSHWNFRKSHTGVHAHSKLANQHWHSQRCPRTTCLMRSPWHGFCYACGTVKAGRSHALLLPRVSIQLLHCSHTAGNSNIQRALFTCVFNYEWAFTHSEKTIVLIQ